MHYAKIVSLDGKEEHYLDMFGKVHNDPVPLTAIELQWALKGFLDKYEEKFQLFVSTGVVEKGIIK